MTHIFDHKEYSIKITDEKYFVFLSFSKFVLQSQTKIVGTVNAKAFFPLPVLSFSLPMLFIAIQSANRVHQH